MFVIILFLTKATALIKIFIKHEAKYPMGAST